MNRLELRTLPPYTTLSHGGNRNHRQHELFVNGVLVRSFSENTQKDNYQTGKSYDELIQRTVETYEQALACKVERTSRAHWTADLKARVLELLHPGGLEEIEWSGTASGPGDGPMGSGPGPLYSACPVCRGLKEKSPGFTLGAVGHREGCELDRLLREGVR